MFEIVRSIRNLTVADEFYGEDLESTLPSLVKFNPPKLITFREMREGEENKKRQHSRVKSSSTLENLVMSKSRLNHPKDIMRLKYTIESCRDAINKEDLKTYFLNSILPPRFYTDDQNLCWEITISGEIADRKDIISLQRQLNHNLSIRRAARSGLLCPVRQILYSQMFDELIRQITTYSVRTGLLLLRMRDELNMSVLTLQHLANNAIERRMGISWETKEYVEDPFFQESETVLILKDNEEVEALNDLYTTMSAENKILKEKRNELRNRLEIIEDKHEDYFHRKKLDESSSDSEFWFLRRYNALLKVHLEETLLSLEIEPHVGHFESSNFAFAQAPVITECTSASESVAMYSVGTSVVPIPSDPLNANRK